MKPYIPDDVQKIIDNMLIRLESFHADRPFRRALKELLDSKNEPEYDYVVQRVWEYENHMGSIMTEGTNIGVAASEEVAQNRVDKLNEMLKVLASHSSPDSMDYTEKVRALCFFDEQAKNYDWPSISYTWEKVPSTED